jgi:hypothetical protein
MPSHRRGQEGGTRGGNFGHVRQIDDQRGTPRCLGGVDEREPEAGGDTGVERTAQADNPNLDDHRGQSSR